MNDQGRMQYGQINVSVANLYLQPQYRSEVVSQALLGEKCTVVQSDRNFSKIVLEDGYEGWLSDYQWVKSSEGMHNTENVPARVRARVRAHFIQIFEKPDFQSRPVRDAVIGTQLEILAEEQEWFRVLLPDALGPGRVIFKEVFEGLHARLSEAYYACGYKSTTMSSPAASLPGHGI